MRRIRYILLLAIGLLVCNNLVAAKKFYSVKSKLLKAYFDSTCHDVLPLEPFVISRNITDGEFWYYKGLCEKQLKQFETAHTSFNMALRHNYMHKAAVYYNIAICESQAGRIENAIHYLEETKRLGVTEKALYQKAEFDPIRNTAEFRSFYASLTSKLDIWALVLIATTIIGWLLAAHLIVKPGYTAKANLWLVLLICVFTLNASELLLYWTGYYEQFPYLRMWRQVSPLLIGPLVFFYIHDTVQVNKLRQKWLHFIPAIIATVFLLPWYFYFLNRYGGNATVSSPIMLWGGEISRVGWIKVVHMSLYAALIFPLIKRLTHSNRVFNQWIRFIYMAFIAIIITFSLYYLVVNTPVFNARFDYALILGKSLFVFGIAYLALVQPNVFRGLLIPGGLQQSGLKKDFSNAEFSGSKYKKSSLTPSASTFLKLKLEKLMEEEKLYKDSNIRLEELARRLDTSRHNISQVINEQFNCNYFDYINRYRIDFVISRFEDKKYAFHTISELSYEAGFNNKVSFSNAFKRFMGKTPSAYRKEIANKNGLGKQA